MPGPAALLLILAGLVLAPAALAAEVRVTGTATYRERIALPPNARFEAVLLDASRADAPADVLARTAIDNPGQPPIAFAVTVDDSRLDARAHTVLRATITVDGALWFTTDTANPVLGRDGKTHVDLVLRRVGRPRTLLEAPPAPGASGLLGGDFRFVADSAAFSICRTGQNLPVAMEGAYRELEAAYREQRSAPAAPLYVTVEGGVEQRAGMEGPPRPTLVVRRFLGAWPGETCERNRADSDLANTYWKIAVLKGETLAPLEGRREASLILRTGAQRQVSATVGCNRMAGSYETTDDGGLTFGRFASTMMACPPPLDVRERILAEVLTNARAYAIAGSTMVLYDERKEPLAVLRSVALR